MNNYSRYTYKAKRKDNGEWVYGFPIIYASGNIKITIPQCRKDLQETSKLVYGTYEIIPETLCQCTGLQDRDGNYIFENDIVVKNNKEYIVIWHQQAFKYAYYHKEYEDNRSIGDYEYCIGDYLDKCKIISNKFDKEED